MVAMISRAYNNFKYIFYHLKYYSQYIFSEIILIVFFVFLFLSKAPGPQTRSILMVLFPSILAALLAIIFGIGFPNIRNVSIFWSSSQYQFLHDSTFKIIWIFVAGIILPPLSIGCFPFSDVRIEEILYKINFTLFFMCILILIPYIKAMFFLQDPLNLISANRERISILVNLDKDACRINEHIYDIILIIRNMKDDTQRFRDGLKLIREDREITEFIIRNIIFIDEIVRMGYISKNYGSKKAVIGFLESILISIMEGSYVHL